MCDPKISLPVIQSSGCFKISYFLRMDRDRLLNAIRQYCLNNGFSKTAKKIKTLPVNVKDSETIENAFGKYFEKENKPKSFAITGLGFSLKLPTGQMGLRKRLRDIDITEENGKVKKSKKESKKVKNEKLAKKEQEIPKEFLILLDELRLDRKDAKLLFENRDHWAYVKSDRQIFCVEQGIFCEICKNLKFNFFNPLGCNFSNTMAADCLADHCQKSHDWRKRPCPYEWCKFEAYNSYTFKAGSYNFIGHTYDYYYDISNIR